MTTIALPSRNILVPRLEFPAWLRHGRARASNMLPPLGGALSPLAVSGLASNPLADAPQIAHWKFNGNANDSVGANHLTENNSPTYVSGKLGSALQVVRASSQTCSIADNSDLSAGDVDFYIAVWVCPTAFDDYCVIAAKGDGVSAAWEWYLYTNVTPDKRVAFQVMKAGWGSTIVTGSTFGALSAGTWYLVEAYHDSVNDLIGVAVNNGAFDTTAWANGVNDGNQAFVVGGLANGAGYYSDAKIDSMRFFKGSGAILTTAQRTYLYNSGNGTEN